MQLAHTITPEVVGWGRQGKNKLQPLRSKVSWKCLLSTTSTENVLLPWSYRWSLLHESLYYLFVCMFCFDRDEIWNWKKGIWEGGGGGAGRGGGDGRRLWWFWAQVRWLHQILYSFQCLLMDGRHKFSPVALTVAGMIYRASRWNEIGHCRWIDLQSESVG